MRCARDYRTGGGLERVAGDAADCVDPLDVDTLGDALVALTRAGTRGTRGGGRAARVSRGNGPPPRPWPCIAAAADAVTAGRQRLRLCSPIWA